MYDLALPRIDDLFLNLVCFATIAILDMPLLFHHFFEVRSVHIKNELGSHVAHSVGEVDIIPSLHLTPHLELDQLTLLLFLLCVKELVHIFLLRGIVVLTKDFR